MKKKIHYLTLLLGFIIVINANSTVLQHDSVIVWQHHRYSLNSDNSIATMTKLDNDIVTVQFNGKVIENELFRIVLVPEFGGRVLSYFYKPTSHEYLYQSACGTPYGIGAGNFYYNWLMVYGGIFPTFPEPEHGKTWLKPWQYSIVKNTTDTVIVKMSITDNTEYSARPGQFNNGVTGIVCDLEVGVYSGKADFSFNATLRNPGGQTKKYEYWTCTTLAPGSDKNNTFTPINSEIVAPMQQYEAAWSPNGWIGKNGNTFDFSKINMLNEWTDMGIGYGLNRTADYWGVINHENKEGFFRIADRNITKGLKLWTWGKGASNANVLQISNGGKDDYIELWGGTVQHFFDDALLSAASSVLSSEKFFPTIGLSDITAMNENGGVWFDVNVNSEINRFNFNLKSFLTGINQPVKADFFLNDAPDPVHSENFISGELGNVVESTITSDKFINGGNTIKVVLKNTKSEVLLATQKQFNLINTYNYTPIEDNLTITYYENHQISIVFGGAQTADIIIYSYDGKNVYNGKISNGMQIKLINSGIYILKIQIDNHFITRKIVVK